MKIAAFLYVLFISISTTLLSAASVEMEGEAPMAASFGKLPLYFIENQGQMNERVSYYVQGSDKTIYFTAEGVTFALKEKDTTRRWTVKLDFVGADCSAALKGEDRRDATFSYFKGKPADWKGGVPTYGRLVYEELWPGIDLVYSGTISRLKYEFRVRPGADPEKIRLAYRGVSKIRIDETGALQVQTPVQDFKDGAPVAYQTIEGKRRDVAMRYKCMDGENGCFHYGFEIGTHDPDEVLIMDPVLFVYSGFIGGVDADVGEDIVVDCAGNVYVTGSTWSSETSFPVVTGPDLTFNGGSSFKDAFVAKVNAQGDHLIYCGYIGGTEDEWGYGIAVDPNGCAYVTGYTVSDESSFPVLLGPDITFNGSIDAFVAKVSADGSALEYCGYIGGEKYDYGRSIAVDWEGFVHVTGSTSSSESSFPVVLGPDLTYNGGGDVFVARINAKGTGFDYCGYIGGSETDSGYGISLDSKGNVYVAGFTSSDETSFPILIGPDLSHNGGTDVFVARVNMWGTGLDYCGYIGGSKGDSCGGIAVDREGCAYVTGYTGSTESSFPVKKGPDLSYNGDLYEAFVAKVNASGSELAYCGYIGGDDYDLGRDIAVDNDGIAYVTGNTCSTQSTFPVKDGPDLTYNGGVGGYYGGDAFAAKVVSDGTALDYCGYIGGSGDEMGKGIAVDGKGNAYVTGRTSSYNNSFPTIIGPDLTYNGGTDDVFVSRISRISLTADVHTLSSRTGGIVTFTLDAGADNANRGYILLGSMSGTDPGTLLPGGAANLPINWDFFSNVVATAINTSMFSNFLGQLDASGAATASFDTQGSLPPAFVGTVMHFAFALNSPWDFASDPAAVEIVP